MHAPETRVQGRARRQQRESLTCTKARSRPPALRTCTNISVLGDRRSRVQNPASPTTRYRRHERGAVPGTQIFERVGTALADPTRRWLLLHSWTVRHSRPRRRPWRPTDERLESLGCLRGCGLVRATREGRQVRYEFASPALSTGPARSRSAHGHAQCLAKARPRADSSR
jgi:hypothetical protein